MRSILLAGLTVLALSACGGKDDAEPTTQSDQPAAAPAGNASAAEVAKEARGKLKCPPKLTTAARAAGAPVDDIQGVRPGMSYDEAAQLVMCSHELMVVTEDKRARFNIPTYGQTLRQGFNAEFAKERVQKTGQEIMQEMQARHMARANNAVVRDIAPGEAKWFVGTLGLPGQERVTDVAREEWFAEGRQPTVAAVEKALIDKYGTPIQYRPGGGELRWAFDPYGRPVTEASPLSQACYANAYLNSGMSFSPDCGVIVGARIVPMRDNPAIAESLTVVVANQAEGYERITATEQALLAQENARRAKQAEDAAKNADAPKL
ncbi:MAG: hypothetical protein LDL19_11660 [Thiobacillus sp.]|nr:hypothetical protein [Thiobacillus sp.]